MRQVPDSRPGVVKAKRRRSGSYCCLGLLAPLVPCGLRPNLVNQEKHTLVVGRMRPELCDRKMHSAFCAIIQSVAGRACYAEQFAPWTLSLFA